MPNNQLAPKLLSKRVRSFPADPLHSAAYLSNLLAYLTHKAARSTRYQAPTQTLSESIFLHAYKLSSSGFGQPLSYSHPSEFLKSDGACHSSELIFLTGYPSPDWIDAVVNRFGVDLRFVHSHLDFVPDAQRKWYTSPGLPSRRHHAFRLRIPSIVFVGVEGRRLSAEELHAARNSCARQLLYRAKAFLSGSTLSCGQSIVRQVNIHRGDAIVLEQEVSLTIVGEGQLKKFIIWSDAGEDNDQIPIPDTPNFRGAFANVEHCPIFFEKELKERSQSAVDDSDHANAQRTRQPLAVLPSRYGETVQGKVDCEQPLSVLQELFHFQTAAASQYLNMLRDLTLELHTRTHPTGDSPPTMEDLLHFEYTKGILVRWAAHFRALLLSFDDCSFGRMDCGSQGTNSRTEAFTIIQRDLEFLRNEAEVQIGLCESGKSTIMSSFSVFDSRRAAEESKLVTRLTQATNRITLIFFPVSLVTSIFGMNFKQFGQGPLSITLWVMVTIPLLCLCIIVSECGGKLWRHTKQCYFARK